MRHFLQLSDLSLAEHEALFQRAIELKRRRNQSTLLGKVLCLVFEKASTRTRLSFEVGMLQLGGQVVVLDNKSSQLGRGEPIEDTARVTSRYVDAIMFRTFGEDRLRAFAAASTVPVINGLSDGGHPVQLLADLMTIRERLGDLRGKVVAWLGDGASNMAISWVEASELFGFELRIAAPSGYRLPGVKAWECAEACTGADVVSTDVWTSMGQEAENAARMGALGGYQLDGKLLALAKPHAIVLHCLPAHRGEEITAEVLEGPQSAVWDEAENRMHAQKALLELLLR